MTFRDLPTERANADCFDCGGALMRYADPDTGLMTPDVQCRDCHREYGPGEYALALRASWEARLDGWVPLVEATRISGANTDTVHKWAQRGVIGTAMRDDGRRMVWWPDVQARLAPRGPLHDTG